MTASSRRLTSFLHRHLSEKIVTSFQDYVKTSKPRLWGLNKKDHLRKLAVKIALFKDCKGISYQDLKDRLPSSIKWSKHTLQHNQKLIRYNMEEWADQVMTRAQLDMYLNSSTRQGNKKMRKKSVLLLDSSDFGLVGKYHTQKTNKLWSYKLNGPGRRYQLLTDANGVPIKIWGGFSPKLYDGHWLSAKRNWFEKRLNGAVVLADCHYWSAQDEFKKCTLMPVMPKTIKPKHGMVRVGNKNINVSCLMWKREQMEIKKLRSNVERPFGQMKIMFKVLSNIFRDKESQLDCLVKFAAACVQMKSSFYHN